jgi:DNA invertase Pin-like site-specific DNA recombinase
VGVKLADRDPETIGGRHARASGPIVLNQERVKKIVRMIDDGHSTRETGVAFGVSHVAIWKTWHRWKKWARQET